MFAKSRRRRMVTGLRVFCALGFLLGRFHDPAGAQTACERTYYDPLTAGAVFFAGKAEPPVSVAIGDLDGDGLPDRVATFFGAPPTLVVSLSDGAFCSGDSTTLDITFSGPVVLADVTGDGFADALVSGITTRLIDVFENDGAGGFSLLASIPSGRS